MLDKVRGFFVVHSGQCHLHLFPKIANRPCRLADKNHWSLPLQSVVGADKRVPRQPDTASYQSAVHPLNAHNVHLKYGVWQQTSGESWNKIYRSREPVLLGREIPRQIGVSGGYAGWLHARPQIHYLSFSLHAAVLRHVGHFPWRATPTRCALSSLIR
ncbi:Uncharacterised protein [Vibrio cholerae]|uniref:Uncharacterized protein n=1 Tax=Vibrio cholerae TaxID=666 RepID=A0A655WSL0_VIBCL|nr:Uncharacterised protein [Vibrio cholerae]CSB70232.1 Uncharacterised protein [Vibrio cholerae]CSB97456.1 Uncharacterised protein [Vibrio cholerae]